jgi:hypothetical protein
LVAFVLACAACVFARAVIVFVVAVAAAIVFVESALVVIVAEARLRAVAVMDAAAADVAIVVAAKASSSLPGPSCTSSTIAMAPRPEITHGHLLPSAEPPARAQRRAVPVDMPLRRRADTRMIELRDRWKQRPPVFIFIVVFVDGVHFSLLGLAVMTVIAIALIFATAPFPSAAAAVAAAGAHAQTAAGEPGDDITGAHDVVLVHTARAATVANAFASVGIRTNITHIAMAHTRVLRASVRKRSNDDRGVRTRIRVS